MAKRKPPEMPSFVSLKSDVSKEKEKEKEKRACCFMKTKHHVQIMVMSVMQLDLNKTQHAVLICWALKSV